MRDEDGQIDMTQVVATITDKGKEILGPLLEHFHRFGDQKAAGKPTEMTPSNLAKCWAPNMFEEETSPTLESYRYEGALQRGILTQLIEHPDLVKQPSSIEQENAAIADHPHGQGSVIKVKPPVPPRPASLVRGYVPTTTEAPTNPTSVDQENVAVAGQVGQRRITGAKPPIPPKPLFLVRSITTEAPANPTSVDEGNVAVAGQPQGQGPKIKTKPPVPPKPVRPANGYAPNLPESVKLIGGLRTPPVLEQPIHVRSKTDLESWAIRQ